MSQYDDRPARPTSGRSSGSRASERTGWYGSDAGQEYPYDPSAEQHPDYSDGYPDYSKTSGNAGSGLAGAGDTTTTVLEPPQGFAFDDEEPDEGWSMRWNAGADLGLLLMRLVLGGIFAAHGAQKVFGWFDGPGLDGFADFLAGEGYEQTDILAAVTGFTELVGGVLIMLGVFTPLAAAGLLGVMINVIWLKWNEGLFAASGGFELELALAALAAGLTLAGPGRAALDYGRAWFRHSVATGWVCLFLGAGSAVAVQLLLRS